ncbi:MAG: hypothetical protein HC824_05745 [Synechococcales cyanobacterium RM1_1_8]|nr:hypothetical protein [Synechococcales cyanobacterium RM1_1_8]
MASCLGDRWPQRRLAWVTGLLGSPACLGHRLVSATVLPQIKLSLAAGLWQSEGVVG